MDDLLKDKCNEIRRYGNRIARYDMEVPYESIDNGYDQSNSIIVYEYQHITYYIVMCRGQFINLLW